jgi:hypothetical protein
MHDALADLRRTRRARRLGDTEWFDLAYNVYLTALLGGGAVLVASGWVGDEALSDARLADVWSRGPAVIGLVAAAAIAIGLRSGADGGPVSVESADVRHLLLSPLPRRSTLLLPYLQRMRTVALASAAIGAIAGNLAAQRLPGSSVAWAASGALAGGLVGSLYVSVAVITHTIGVHRVVAGGLAVGVLGVQLAAVATERSGPFDVVGSLAMWGWEQDPVDLVAVAVAIALAGTAAALVGRLRLEPLVRRGELVSQLRFAVTVQDLRTVVVLRRQLRSESPRRRPWVRIPHGRTPGVAAGRRRGAQSIARTPLGRLVRMVLLATLAGVAAVATLRGTTPAVVAMALLGFVLGLDAIEPLSQEIDHGDRTDALPVERGRLHLQLLVAPAVLVAIVSLVGGLVVGLAEPGTWAAAMVLAPAVGLMGAAGAAVNAIRDQIGPASLEVSMVPPELVGLGTVVRTLVPVLVSATAALPVLLVRATPGSGAVVRGVVLAALVVAATGWWIVRRDRWARSWAQFKEQAKVAT